MDGRYMTEEQWAEFFALVKRIVGYAGMCEAERIHTLANAVSRYDADEDLDKFYNYLAE